MHDNALTDPPVSSSDFYRILRAQIEHEDNLITQRLSWFLASQAFLFSAFAILINGPEKSPFGGREQMTFFRFLPLIGIAIGVLIWIAILGGVLSMSRLRRLAAARPDLAPFPPIHGPWYTRRMGLAAPLLLPPLFVAVWAILLAVG
jgi:hypothetical protein